MYITVRKLITPLLCVLFFAYQSKAQFTTCAAAAASPAGSNLTSGACLTGQNNTVSAAGANCGRGFNGSKPSLFFPFIAGSCPEFDITFNANEEVQFILWTSGCALVGGSIECSNATANVTISESYSTTSGPVLTSGTRYILQVLTRTVANYSICYTANTPEAANNECSGASGLSPIGATFNNGGNCSYSGSANDPTTSDPPASTFCAGSLENTQWITFQPTAGATSFQIIGSSIACGGPVCAWQFGIFSGSCAALTPEGCVSNGNPCTNGPDPNTFSTNPPGGNGTTTESTDYAFIDVAPYSGTSYYRVKQVDYNGDFEYSELVSVSSADKDVKVLKTINLTGQEVNSNYKGLVIDFLSNGTTHKRVQM